jgi:hypothetical protein
MPLHRRVGRQVLRGTLVHLDARVIPVHQQPFAGRQKMMSATDLRFWQLLRLER